MRWTNSFNESKSASSQYADAVIRLIAANAKDGGRQSTSEVKNLVKALVKSKDDPIVELATSAGCPSDEIATFVFCVCVERSLERQRILAGLHPEAVGSVRLGMLDLLADDDHQGVATVGPHSRLRRARLVEVSHSGPFASRTVAVHPTVMWGLFNDPTPDPSLPFATRLLERPGSSGDSTSLLVSGEDPTRRRTLLLKNLAGSRALIVRDPTDQLQWDAVVREATLTRSALIIEIEDSLSIIGSNTLTDANHLVLGLSSLAGLDPETLPPRAWRELVAGDKAASSEEIAAVLGQASPHPLTADQLRRVHATLPLVDGDVTHAVRRLTDHRLFKLGNRKSPSRTWDDLIIDDECLSELRDLTDRYRYASQVRETPELGRHVSPGVLAVFAGSSGTGKTLAAEVIAGDLGLELVKIDLSTVVSKYIGETEKNLEEVFDAASVGGALVLFDEGDALFGKRSEVSDARDRYANIEVAYLLQRVETFEGFVIISTNLIGNVDQAFQRRIQAMIEFSTPDLPTRIRLWQLHLPLNRCARGITHEELGAITMSGGNIRNIAVSAAFLAAAENSLINRDHLRISLRREMRKLGRLTQDLLV